MDRIFFRHSQHTYQVTHPFYLEQTEEKVTTKQEKKER